MNHFDIVVKFEAPEAASAKSWTSPTPTCPYVRAAYLTTCRSGIILR